jgi:uncharacterized protein YoxC
MSQLNPLAPVENAIKGILMTSAFMGMSNRGGGVSVADYNEMVEQANQCREMAVLVARALKEQTLKARAVGVAADDLQFAKDYLEEKVQQLEADIERLLEENQELADQVRILNRDVDYSMDRVVEYEDAINDLTNRVDEERARNLDLARSLQAASEENGKLKAQIEEMRRIQRDSTPMATFDSGSTGFSRRRERTTAPSAGMGR